MNKISVIIPAYNAAQTVEKTVRNVLASTITIDVYVVDDGSTDGTGEVLEKVGRESRSTADGSSLVVIHQANQGAYMARLNALKQIKTPWFGFVDADDTVEPDMFEKMLAFAECENCDVVQCGVEGIPESDLGQWYVRMMAEKVGRESRSTAEDSILLERRNEVERQFIEPHLIKGQGSSFIWNKLYRNQYDFSKFVTFERLTNYDDMIFNFQFFEKIQRMGFLPDKPYHYAATVGSATHSYGERQFNDFQACAKFRKERNMSSARWLSINLKSAVASVVRAKMGVGEKLKWLLRLSKFAMENV